LREIIHGTLAIYIMVSDILLMLTLEKISEKFSTKENVLNKGGGWHLYSVLVSIKLKDSPW